MKSICTLTGYMRSLHWEHLCHIISMTFQIPIRYIQHNSAVQKVNLQPISLNIVWHHHSYASTAKWAPFLLSPRLPFIWWRIWIYRISEIDKRQKPLNGSKVIYTERRTYTHFQSAKTLTYLIFHTLIAALSAHSFHINQWSCILKYTKVSGTFDI